MVIWSFSVALGASAASALAVKALAQNTAPALPVAAQAVTVPAQPSPASNPTPVPATTMAHSCAACHGTNGQLGDESFQPLAGMPIQQFVATMIDFREGRRPATLMGHVARGFSDDDIRAMGEFFAAQPPLPRHIAEKGAL